MQVDPRRHKTGRASRPSGCSFGLWSGWVGLLHDVISERFPNIYETIHTRAGCVLSKWNVRNINKKNFWVPAVPALHKIIDWRRPPIHIFEIEIGIGESVVVN